MNGIRMNTKLKFNKETLEKIERNLDSNEDLNDYRRLGLVSIVLRNEHDIKIFNKKFPNQVSVMNDIVIANTWVYIIPDIPSIIPEHLNKCLCETPIRYHYWIKNIKTNYIRLIGSCCIQKFMGHRGKSCIECNQTHKNIKSNYCSRCRQKCYVHNTYHSNNFNCSQYLNGKITFGKYKYTRLNELPSSYLKWLRTLENKPGFINNMLDIVDKYNEVNV